MNIMTLERRFNYDIMLDESGKKIKLLTDSCPNVSDYLVIFTLR